MSKGEKSNVKTFFIRKHKIFTWCEGKVVNIFPLENSTSEPAPKPTPNPLVFYTPKQTRVWNGISTIKISPFKLG